MWFTVQLIFILLGIGLFFAGDKLAMPLLENAGIACFGVACIVVGWEGIITRRLLIGSRRHGSRRLYTGVAAMLQGVQFNLIGLFLIGIAFLLQTQVDSRALGEQFARHPGIPLMVLGMICLLQAAIAFVGSPASPQNSRFVLLLDLVLARLLPGIILAVLGIAAMGFGFFEIVAPNAFDQMGGKILETLYGLK